MATGYSKGLVANGKQTSGQVQNVKASRVYVFGNDDVVDDDEQIEFELPEIRSRGKGGNNVFTASQKEEVEQPQYFEKLLQEGDTLQNIALKYACPVSELKRLNNLIQDQEFHALKVLKVPLHKFGLLAEQLAKGELEDAVERKPAPTFLVDTIERDNSYLGNDSDSQQDFSDPETQAKVIRTLSIRENSSLQGKEAEKFLRKFDADLQKHRHCSPSESLDEVISVCSDRSFYPIQQPKKTNGANWGITNRTIIIISIMIATVPALIFGLHYYLQNDELEDTSHPNPLGR